MINFNVDSVGSGEDVLQVQSAAGVVHVGGVREVPPPGLRGGVGCFPLCWRPGEPVSDVLADQLDCNLVFRPPWNDYICKLLGGHTELLKGRLHIVDVLVKNLIKIAAQLIDILEDPLGKPTVRVRVNEQLHVEHASDLWTVKGEDPFEENNIHLLNQCKI